MPGDAAELKTAELTAIIREIQDRVRARFPQGSAGEVPLPDLLPVVHARDAAQAKVAAIGSVNPRPPGLLNHAIQSVKRAIARSLNWFVRDQVEFNRAAMDCVAALLEALNETRRSLAATGAELHRIRTQDLAEARAEISELRDIRAHWAQWRVDWEARLAANEVQFLRSVADLQTGFSHRASLMESNFRDHVRGQNADFHAALGQAIDEIQKRLWADLDRIRTDYERLIHDELRTVRQRAAALNALPPAASVAAPASAPRFDYLRFAHRFRGAEDYVSRSFSVYVPHFSGRRAVLDIGCGRGEFLELMRENGVPARGIDLSEESVQLCRSKGLDAEAADLFPYLGGLAAGSLDGIFCSQVVEHLPPARLPEFIALAREVLAPGGLLAIETPNPECLAIFATHFYLDPTHQRPIPPGLLCFYLEEAGFGRLHLERLAPAIETMPSLAELPAAFREAFFGSLDYAVLAHRL